MYDPFMQKPEVVCTHILGGKTTTNRTNNISQGGCEKCTVVCLIPWGKARGRGMTACLLPSMSFFLSLVHECHSALWLASKYSREKLQRQAHMDWYEDIGGVDHHGDSREEDRVEDRFFPGLQDIDACDEQVLVVEPSQVLPQVFEIHPAGWRMETQGGVRWSNKRCEGAVKHREEGILQGHYIQQQIYSCCCVCVRLFTSYTAMKIIYYAA